MKEFLPTLLDILKYTLPALIVLIAVNHIVKRFTVMEVERKQLTLLQETQDITIRLRLQAYERLILLVERIQPRNLLPRIYAPGLTVREFQHLLTEAINIEYEHNLAQQLYVSRQVWISIINVREQELNMINSIAKEMKPDDDGRLLQTRIIDFLMSAEQEMPADIALQVIHEEARMVLAYVKH